MLFPRLPSLLELRVWSCAGVLLVPVATQGGTARGTMAVSMTVLAECEVSLVRSARAVDTALVSCPLGFPFRAAVGPAGVPGTVGAAGYAAPAASGTRRVELVQAGANAPAVTVLTIVY